MNKTVSEGHVVTGVLGKEFAYGSAVKIVIIELLDMEECFEIAQVYGENEDFLENSRKSLYKTTRIRYNREWIKIKH